MRAAPIARAALWAALAAALALPAAAAAQAPDRNAQSVAAFEAMASVMTGPRCQNCHTLTDFPRQGDDRHRHLFHVTRGPDGHGAPGLRCTTCHNRANNTASGVPGADEAWGLAPLSMGWEGLSHRDLCLHLKDPSRNGNRSGAAVIDHLRTHLVTWAWAPGKDARGQARTGPALDYPTFLKAAETWVATGQACPDPAR